MNLLYSLFPLLGINLWQFSAKVSVQVYNIILVYPNVCYIYMYTDQDVTVVARYFNQKGCYYTLQPFIKYQKYRNKWMSGFFKYNIYTWKWEGRSWLNMTFLTVWCVLCCLLPIIRCWGSLRWTCLVPTYTVTSHCLSIWL